MRAFLALVPPASVLAEVEDFVAPRRQPDWRWTDPDHRHLTLAFTDALTPEALDRLSPALQTWADRQAPVTMRLAGAGAFPDPDRARVLWLGVDPPEAAQACGRLARVARDLFSHSGAPADGARFTPHLTVARAHRPTRTGKLLGVLDLLRTSPFEADAVQLIESRLRGGGPRYRTLATFAFGATASN